MTSDQHIFFGEYRFKKLIDQSEISNAIAKIARQISTDYQGKTPLILGVLNGAFIFMSDLIRAMSISVEIDFIRARSYDGLSSTGQVKLDTLKVNLKDRHIIIVEDIVDKGHTLDKILRAVSTMGPESVKVACFLKKPQAFLFEYRVDYCCFEISNEFVIGYGLDYNEMGRELPHLYQLDQVND